MFCVGVIALASGFILFGIRSGWGPVVGAILLPILFASAVWIIQRSRSSISVPSKTSSDSLSFFFVGDSGTGGKAPASVAAQMAALSDSGQRPEAVMLLGDNVLGATPFSIAVLDRFYEPFRPVIERHIPFHAILGNHDYAARRTDKELRFKPFNMNGRDHYQADFGDGLVSFFAITAETALDSDVQINWLRTALAASASRWNVLLCHEPLHAGKIHHKDNKELYAALMPIITAAPGIDLVFSGHNHVYERRKVHSGIQHLTIGTGGKLCRKGPFLEDPDRVVGHMKSRAFLAAKFSIDNVAIQVIDDQGKTIDSFTVTKAPDGKGVVAMG